MGLIAFILASAPTINLWAVSRFGEVASMNNRWGDSFVYWLTYMSPYVRIGDFILGCLIAQVYLVACGREVLFLTLGLLLVSITGAALIGASKEDFVLAPAVASATLFAVSWKTWISKILSWAPVLALGDASYSIYLTHYVILTALARTISDYPGIALFIAYATIIPLSLILYAKYEAPMRRWIGGPGRSLISNPETNSSKLARAGASNANH